MLKLDYLLKSLYRTLRRFIRTGDATAVEGHMYIETEVHEGCTVTVSHCEHCGAVDVGWRGG